MNGFKDVRVRIAPSPTGDPHVGLAYITLFNYVFAKKHGGKLVLRIEDTDQLRAKASSEEQIATSLRWLGLSWDEGPDVGGDYGPYKQSERQNIHREHADRLVAGGHAYRCYCTPERLTALREEQKKANQTTRYDGHCRQLSTAESAAKDKEGLAFVVRLKVPNEGTTSFRDALRGEITIDNERVDDQVLLKSDGFPTYHLANVVDDHLMAISHVIRAEEWISSTPKHVLLYKAFGWQAPTFVHMPILRNSDRSKISKRKNPVSLNYYRRKGILPAALLNFLALMGWSFGDNQEIFTIDDMMAKFKLQDMHLGGPVFDVVKLTRINQHYMHAMTPTQFADYVRDEIFSRDYLERLHPLVLERMDAFEQFVDKNSFFFNGALSYDGLDIIPKGRDKEAMRLMFSELLLRLDDLYEWQAFQIHKLLDEHRAEIGWKPKDYFMPVRLVVSGRKDSPPLAESMELIGREMVRFRIRDFLESAVVAE